MIQNNFSLVDWGMGAALIGVFAVVCVILVLVVLNLMNSDKKKNEE
ncbi:hypothetical protein [Ulvibacter antarcticus]|uniref:DUF3149 domain-containing protein n=1 Tax=Ulvibacter antarcticus TaxID=442714 RepID=A0A3L9YGP9_9FLAO|nr:hypothetical protein [Ulvibacter antarcticus]RMA58727.1 hypothetical protein BXY75_2104 [Ulvibacter antarcticus]